MKTKFNNLDKIDKSNPFKVPDNYFENFNKEIMKNLPEKEYPKPIKVTMWDRVKPWVYLAAMFAGLYVTINFVLTKSSGVNTNTEPVVTQHTEQVISGTDNYW